MNNKKYDIPYGSLPGERLPDPSRHLHEVKVNGHLLKRGMLLSVHRRPNLIGGKWVFKYAEQHGGILMLHIEGPLARETRHKVIRPEDIKTIHTRQRKG